ncbi:acetyl-CoA C-acetyltransferase [Macrococcus equipercicus]|uniref:Probable acetyl-CoA acyltransferase n=1 Tax=Macrococcus equipercicus TaxID=69967 RepID=A0A9Q9BV69_9STAP|nr:acetyl-CoA C-acetyltransferase [Macrococcus equipercicus]UTH13568.1 acetyl-CoA C-acetyltransferase [Macrococcus equipercicus]
MTEVVIVAGKRTPFGKLGGSLKTKTAGELGGIAIKGALDSISLEPDKVDAVIMGNVLQAGQGQLPSRQAQHHAGIPFHVHTETINKVCASGMRAVSHAMDQLKLGHYEAVVAGGMESMSNAVFYSKDMRSGKMMGNVEFIDGLIYDGLTCSFTGGHMGVYGDKTAAKFNLSRAAQDQFSFDSHQKAVAATDAGLFDDEITPVEVKGRKETVIVDKDEAPRRDTTVDKLAALKPAFVREGGTVTAGNAPGINDGACALILMTKERAAAEGLDVLATLIAHSEIGVAPERFPETPGLVINKLLEEQQLTADDITLFEMNEAFSAVALASQHIAQLPSEKINQNGGAVALGHPIGASGARIILTLIHSLKRAGGGKGIAAICSGGGQGDAVLLEV